MFTKLNEGGIIQKKSKNGISISFEISKFKKLQSMAELPSLSWWAHNLIKVSDFNVKKW